MQSRLAVTLQGKGAPELQMRQSSDGLIEHNSRMIEGFLILSSRFAVEMCRKISLFVGKSLKSFFLLTTPPSASLSSLAGSHAPPLG